MTVVYVAAIPVISTGLLLKRRRTRITHHRHGHHLKADTVLPEHK